VGDTHETKMPDIDATHSPYYCPEEYTRPYYAYVTHKPKPGWQTPQGMGVPVYDPAYGRLPPQGEKY